MADGAPGGRDGSPVLVGRAEELHRLTEALRSAPAVVLIEGEAGIGKTRLIREALRRPRDGAVPQRGARAGGVPRAASGWCSPGPARRCANPSRTGRSSTCCARWRVRCRSASTPSAVRCGRTSPSSPTGCLPHRSRSPTRPRTRTGCSARSANSSARSGGSPSSWRTCTGPTTAPATSYASSSTRHRPGWSPYSATAARNSPAPGCRWAAPTAIRPVSPRW
ncbi:AAA family ATPase [Kitasatospora sp. NBC_01539]